MNNLLLISRISKAATLFRHNPALLARIVYANVARRMGGAPKRPVQKEINGVKFEFDFSLGPQLRQMYFDAYEPLTLAAMKRFLRRGDIFLDVGANMGFIACIAAGIVGKEGQVHCFEPSPADFDRLKKLAVLNPDYKIFCNPWAAERRIYLIRGHKVMLSIDLAELYGVEPRALVQAVKRNGERFPEDFMFQLNRQEFENLKSQIVISSWGGIRRAAPYAFTEQGVAMLSSVLRSRQAIQVNIAIMRAFVKLRRILSTHKELAQKLAELEAKISKHDKEIQAIFEVILRLMAPPTRAIGFHP